jgi:hypothetical protein
VVETGGLETPFTLFRKLNKNQQILLSANGLHRF